MSDLGEFMQEFEAYLPPDTSRVVKAPATVFQDMEGMFGPGVYALCRDGEIIYVGKAKVLIQRIYGHWNAMCRLRSGKEAYKHGPKGMIFSSFKIMPCSLYDLDRLEKQMIARFRPKMNKLLVPEKRVTLEQVGFDYTRFAVERVAATPVFRRRL